MARQFSVYEKNFLLKHGFDYSKITSNEPVEYLVGKALFYNRDFIVDSSVLIPRIETEEIIKIVKNYKRNFKNILDLGCGSGVIGITLFLELNKSSLTLIDISEDALKIAKENVEKLIGENKNDDIKIVKSNLFKNIDSSHKFDLIVANLPYIPHSRVEKLDKSVLDYEPILALDGGENGVEVINKFLEQFNSYLTNRGIVILEIDDTHNLDSFNIPFNFKGDVIKDEFGRNRFLVLEKF